MRRLIGMLARAAALAAVTAGLVEAASGGPAGDGDGARADIELVIEPDGTMRARGLLPKGIGRAEFAAIFPGVRMADDLASGGADEPAPWRRAFEALHVALPRIERARIRLCERRIAIEGRLREGFALRETRPALRAALGPDWTLDAELRESPPGADVAFRLAAGRAELTGILPEGLSVRHALATVGDGADGQLTTGGGGDSAAWAAALGAIGRLAALYDSGEGRIAGTEFAVTGRLAPGQTAGEIGAWLAAALGPRWTVEVAGEAREAGPGARRIAPDTGETERLVAGRWLPVLSFEPDAEECDRRMQAAQRTRRLVFVSGQSTLDDAGARVLDRLAAIALVCLRGTRLRLEIGGHTDGRGDSERNRALSEARAEAVRAELARRGVPAVTMEARGYGAERPVATNDTVDGRKRNRRISFAWAPG